MGAVQELSRKERKRLAKKRRKEAKRLAKLRRKQSKRKGKRRDERIEDRPDVGRSFVDTGYSFGGRKDKRGEYSSFVSTDHSFGGRREGDGGIYRGSHFGLKGDDGQKGYVGLGKGHVGLGKGHVGLGKGYVDIGSGSAIQLGNSMTDRSSSASTAGARDGFTIFGKPASKQNNSRFGGMRYF